MVSTDLVSQRATTIILQIPTIKKPPAKFQPIFHAQNSWCKSRYFGLWSFSELQRPLLFTPNVADAGNTNTLRERVANLSKWRQVKNKCRHLHGKISGDFCKSLKVKAWVVKTIGSKVDPCYYFSSSNTWAVIRYFRSYTNNESFHWG